MKKRFNNELLTHQKNLKHNIFITDNRIHTPQYV